MNTGRTVRCERVHNGASVTPQLRQRFRSCEQSTEFQELPGDRPQAAHVALAMPAQGICGFLSLLEGRASSAFLRCCSARTEAGVTLAMTYCNLFVEIWT